jgi:glutathione synthase/RimK-type ligase-like ATP-grasp enzyme
MARRCAYLTMDDLSAFVSDADMSIGPMAALGWDVDMVPWRDTAVDWDDYDLVYICTPWDYQQDAAGFLRVLERIDASRALLVNPIELVRWNLRKDYLRELEGKGAAIVPSVWHRDFDSADMSSWFGAHGPRIVIKPVVGANADDTFVLTKPVSDDLLATLAKLFANRPFFVQPFLESINTEGEYSLFFFGGEYSHAILKKPKAGDFRSQEEHGADILSAEAPADLVETATRVFALVEPQPVYGRADFLRGPDGRFLLMELELIEPSLYFRADPDSATRFARALTEAWERQ